LQKSRIGWQIWHAVIPCHHFSRQGLLLLIFYLWLSFYIVISTLYTIPNGGGVPSCQWYQVT
jgi:hypothetical protein